jgi:hypothetical protein
MWYTMNSISYDLSIEYSVQLYGFDKPYRTQFNFVLLLRFSDIFMIIMAIAFFVDLISQIQTGIY